MVIIIIGAGVTRYFGREGMMGIREESTANTFLTAETYLQFQVDHAGKKYSFDESVLFSTLGKNNFSQSYQIGNQELKVEVLKFIPNPAEVLVEDEAGSPILKVVVAGRNGREEFLVGYGDKVNIYGTLFNFGNAPVAEAFNISYQQDSLAFMADRPFSQMVMATQTTDTLSAGSYHPLRLRSMYSDGLHSFVFGAFATHGRAEVVSADPKMLSTSSGGLDMVVTFGGVQKSALLVGSPGVEGSPRKAQFGPATVTMAYGAKRVELPFAIQLNDFIMERYPGTDNASSYASEVTLLDPQNNLRRDQRIYMNHVLNYGGYRFFQSSFDQDELGTYLSVNYDVPGTVITYVGYILLTIGMLLTLVSKNTRFAQLGQTLKKMRVNKTALGLLLVLGLSLGVQAPARGSVALPPPINKAHATAFGRLVMQDFKGRFKPMNTFAGEVLRKLARKESLQGLTAEQVMLGMAASPREWYHVPLIKLGKHQEIRHLLGTNEDLVKYSDFFNPNGEYKLREQVRAAYNTPQRDRSTFDKELMKLDEKVNICGLIFSGRFMKVFPLPGDTTHTWQSAVPDGPPGDFSNTIVDRFYPVYIQGLQASLQSNDWSLPNRALEELDQYQQKYGGDVLPAAGKLQAELLLNKLNVFNRLGSFYGLLALLFLGLLFTTVFKPTFNLALVGKIAIGLLFAGFLMHTLGLGLRWYVAGRAPWSNGYESMIYIGWTTTLAGLMFARKTYGGLAATMVLAAVILLVAAMNWLDPEITPLVPVLKSYWLMIHVSLEAGSYGFLALGTVIGLLNLIFMIFGNSTNGSRVYRVVKELTLTSEMTLIGGLFMISIGTYLGGVWANESWGRYWGWDAKETWALVTILVYAFILHMRFIPGLRGVLAFNVATLFGFASVMMTYFGVNYYLSGLHSYAAGDPVPIPTWVYYTTISLTVLALLAWWRHRQYVKAGGKM